MSKVSRMTRTQKVKPSDIRARLALCERGLSDPQERDQAFDPWTKCTAEIHGLTVAELLWDSPSAKLSHDNSLALFPCAFPFLADVGALPAFRRRDKHQCGGSIQSGFEILLPRPAGG